MSSEFVLSVPPWRRRLAAAVGAGLAALVSLAASEAGWAAAAAAAGAVAALFGAVYLYLRNYRVVLTHAEIGSAGITGRRRMHPRSQVGSIVRAVLIQPKGAPVLNLFVLDRQGGQLFRVSGGGLRTEDLDRLVAELRVTVRGPREMVTAKRLARDYPVRIPFVERRPVVLALILTPSIVALMFVAIVVAANL